jgi:hypothetical protein
MKNKPENIWKEPSWPNINYCPRICVGVERNHREACQERQCRVQDLKLARSQYKLTSEQARLENYSPLLSDAV